MRDVGGILTFEGNRAPEIISASTPEMWNGVDLHKVKEIIGHKNIAMTMCYAHHYLESLRESVEVLDRCYNFATFEAREN